MSTYMHYEYIRIKNKSRKAIKDNDVSLANRQYASEHVAKLLKSHCAFKSRFI